VANPIEAAELLDVDVDHLARRSPLVADDRHRRLPDRSSGSGPDA
jgi:hypothetical protein